MARSEALLLNRQHLSTTHQTAKHPRHQRQEADRTKSSRLLRGFGRWVCGRGRGPFSRGRRVMSLSFGNPKVPMVLSQSPSTSNCTCHAVQPAETLRRPRIIHGNISQNTPYIDFHLVTAPPCRMESLPGFLQVLQSDRSIIAIRLGSPGNRRIGASADPRRADRNPAIRRIRSSKYSRPNLSVPRRVPRSQLIDARGAVARPVDRP